MTKIGILLTNTGTPDAPTTNAVRRYLREFLSDKRIVQLPRIIWLPILYGIILPLRPRKSAALYQKIWTTDSPMRLTMQALAGILEKHLPSTAIQIGMNYGSPSISSALKKLSEQPVEKIIALPLFPQFSHTSTSSSFDRIHKALTKWNINTPVHYVNDYHDHPAYIQALADSVKRMWEQTRQANFLLISFHGIPERFVAQGDPYAKQCERTAQLLADALKLPPDRWTLCYQSQFGYDKWLKPSTQALLTELPAKGIKQIDIICPGFSVDCLETLEEIQTTGAESFIHSGGKTLRYIPALNDTPAHVDLIAQLIKSLYL